MTPIDGHIDVDGHRTAAPSSLADAAGVVDPADRLR